MINVFDKEESHNFWSNLQIELLSLIQSCLVTERDYYIFDLARKSWKALSPSEIAVSHILFKV